MLGQDLLNPSFDIGGGDVRDDRTAARAINARECGSIVGIADQRKQSPPSAEEHVSQFPPQAPACAGDQYGRHMVLIRT